MQIGNRFRCYPTPAQAKTLLQWIGCQRYMYNAKVGEDQYFRRFARKSLTHTGEFAPIDQQYSQFKTELTPWLSDVPSIILRNGTVLWKQSYSRYFQKLGGRPNIHKVGAEGSKPGTEMHPTLGETEVSRLGGNTPALWSLTQETPAIALA